MSIQILVATHKAYPMPGESMYLPIHVGKQGKNLELGFLGDDTGENISEKNPVYCELTGIYWAWKNMNRDYIGLVHYRRHFRGRKTGDKWQDILTEEQASALLRETDVLLPRRRNYFIETVYNQYVHAHPAEPLDLALRLVTQQGDNYASAVASIKHRTWAHIYNMFVMKWEVFDGYCQWLFPILFEVEQQVDISAYSQYDRRVFGFLAERLLDIYLDANGISYRELPVMFMEQQNWLKKGTAFLKRKFFPRKEG